MWYFLLLCAGFLPEPELSSALLKNKDLFEDPLSSSSADSPSFDVTAPNQAPSPISSVFGSGSSMVTTVMNEHPPTLPPASTKPQVTLAELESLLKAASVVPQCDASVEGEAEPKWAPLLPLGCHKPCSSSTVGGWKCCRPNSPVTACMINMAELFMIELHHGIKITQFGVQQHSSTHPAARFPPLPCGNTKCMCAWRVFFCRRLSRTCRSAQVPAHHLSYPPSV